MLTSILMTALLGKTERGRSLLQRGRRQLPDFLSGAALGVLVFLLVYGVSTLDVTYDGWIYAGYIEQDTIQHYAGWLYFRASEWSWPPTIAENLAIPYGTSITFTDSIPLAAVAAKLFSPFLPATFQYFGWYNLLNFALQGGFAMLLLRRFDLGRVFSALASLLFLFSPVLLERSFRHDALGSQWFVLAALWLYFCARDDDAHFPVVGYWLLCTLSVAVHSYFVPMVYALLAAALLEYTVRRRAWKLPLFTLLGCFGGSLVMAYLTGILTRGADDSINFGHYSMNLNALFNPRSFDWYAGDEILAWSRLLPVLEQGPRQYDGFSYLGLGVLVGLGALVLGGAAHGALSLARGDRRPVRRWLASLVSHWPLLAVCLALSVFAVSNVVMWNETQLFTYPLPLLFLRFASNFRASGRLFWPIYYLLLLCVVLGCARLLRGRGRMLALLMVLVLQLFDLSGVLAVKRAHFAGERIVVENDYTSQGFQYLASNYDRTLSLAHIVDYELGAGLIRYNNAMQTNLRLVNRGSFPNIYAVYQDLTNDLLGGGALEPDTLYLCDNWGVFAALMNSLHPEARGYRVGSYYFLAVPGPNEEGNPLEAWVPPSAGGPVLDGEAEPYEP